jgi:CheY-like chemotaxis protein
MSMSTTEQLQLENEGLRHRLEEAAVRLREADRHKDEFLAMLGHELRNPLAPLRNGIYALNRISSKEPAVQRIRDMMERQIESLVRLVNELLDVSRVTQGKIKLRKEHCDLKDVVARAIESCRVFIEDRGHQLEVTTLEDPLPVEADAVRLIQVVNNLLNNSAKFTPHGGTIRIVVDRDAEMSQAVVHVYDSGMGIAPEMLPKVFDLFTQADPTSSRTEGGLGIGLTLARRLIEMHCGTLEAASAGLGRGSEFIIRLPVARKVTGRERTVQQGRESATGRRPRARRILIVDDNRDSADSLAVLLRILGHEVRQAYDGLEGFAAALEFLPDVLLLDIGLPGMNGYEVAKRIRSENGLRSVRIVAVSGYGSDEDRQRARAAGFDDYLVKPLELASLELILASP